MGAPNSLSIIETVSISVPTPARAVGTDAACITCWRRLRSPRFGGGGRRSKQAIPRHAPYRQHRPTNGAWSDDDQVRAKIRRECRDGRWVVDVDGMQLRLTRHPALPGAANNASTCGSFASADKGVLAGTRPDHENLHFA